MKVKDLTGKEYVWNPQKSIGNRRINASSLHVNAVNFLRFIYPAAQILEEVFIPGEDLYIDIYIPSIKTAIECQGNQHHQHISFYHGKSIKGFHNALDRDRRKKDWCGINNIRIVYFYENESKEQWKMKM